MSSMDFGDGDLLVDGAAWDVPLAGGGGSRREWGAFKTRQELRSHGVAWWVPKSSRIAAGDRGMVGQRPSHCHGLH